MKRDQRIPRDRGVRHLAGWLVLVAVASLVFYWGSGREDVSVPSVKVDMSWVDAAPRLFLADDTGAITMAESGMRGVTRQGAVSWVKSGAELGGLTPICALACPHAVLSGDGDDFQVDPAPLMQGQAPVPKDWLQPTAGGNVILAVRSDAALRVISNAAGIATLQRSFHGASTSEPFAPGVPSWTSQSADHRSGVIGALGATRDGRIPLTFAWLTPQGWQIAATAAQRACISSDGTRRVEDDVLVLGKARIPLPKDLGPQCQFAASGAIFGDRGQPSGTFTFVGNDGKVAWTKPSPPFSWWSASEVTDTIAYSSLTEKTAQIDEVDRTGKVVRTVPGGTSALHTSTGALVTVDREATVTWHPPVN